MKELIRKLLIEIGENPEREGIIDTPKRVNKAWKELTTPVKFDFNTIASEVDEELNN